VTTTPWKRRATFQQNGNPMSCHRLVILVLVMGSAVFTRTWAYDPEELLQREGGISDILYWMSQDERDEMARILKAKLSSGELSPGDRADYILLRLRDPEIRKKFVQEFLTKSDMPYGIGISPSGPANFLELGDPDIIPEMSAGLFKGDPASAGEIQAGDEYFYSVNAAAALVIRDNAAYAREFEPEVRDWAMELDKSRYAELVTILQDWWKTNEHAFRAKQFKEVKPGRKMAKLATAQSLQSDAPDLSSPKPEGGGFKETATAPRSKSDYSWAFPAIAAVGILIVLVIFLRRR
jgi:hypothetical protein